MRLFGETSPPRAAALAAFAVLACSCLPVKCTRREGELLLTVEERAQMLLHTRLRFTEVKLPPIANELDGNAFYSWTLFEIDRRTLKVQAADTCHQSVPPYVDLERGVLPCGLAVIETPVGAAKDAVGEDASTERPSENLVICYFPSWAGYRKGAGKFNPSDIDPSLCTHIVYSFVVLDNTTLTVRSLDTWADIQKGFFRKVLAYKEEGVKVLLAIGGWNDSKGDKYSRLVADEGARRRFVASVVAFIDKHGFDGLDLDWEYPTCWQANCSTGPDSDKGGFVSLLRDLKVKFEPKGWLLTAAVSPSPEVIDKAYDVPAVARLLDWVAVMGYDYHGHWDGRTGHVAPLFPLPGDANDSFNVNSSISYWIQKGAAARKLVLGMPLYGNSFTLTNQSGHGLHAAAEGPGSPGPLSRSNGTLTFTEICSNVKDRSWTVVRDPEGRIGPYAYRGDQWTSYDDVEDIRRKCRFLKERGLAGAMVWALGSDDFKNHCGCGTQPLISTIGQELRGLDISTADCT